MSQSVTSAQAEAVTQARPRVRREGVSDSLGWGQCGGHLGKRQSAAILGTNGKGAMRKADKGQRSFKQKEL